MYTAISIKVVHEQSGKVEYERQRLLGIDKKLMNLLEIPSSFSRLYSTFPLCSWTTLIEIPVSNDIGHCKLLVLSVQSNSNIVASKAIVKCK